MYEIFSMHIIVGTTYVYHANQRKMQITFFLPNIKNLYSASLQHVLEKKNCNHIIKQAQRASPAQLSCITIKCSRSFRVQSRGSKSSAIWRTQKDLVLYTAIWYDISIFFFDTGRSMFIKEKLLRLNDGAMCPHCISVKQKNNEMMQ